MCGSHSLVVENEPDPLDLALLEERLAAAAVAAVGVGEEQDFGIFVRDDDGQLLAGAHGTSWGGCCQVHALWVDDAAAGAWAGAGDHGGS